MLWISLHVAIKRDLSARANLALSDPIIQACGGAVADQLLSQPEGCELVASFTK